MYTLAIECRDGEELIIEFTEKEDARQELMRLLDDGKVSNYRYQLYLGFLLNGVESVMIDHKSVFEITMPVPVEAECDYEN
jgi:hypothetical protein